MNVIRIAGIIRQSIVDGPGLRFVVFTQGCPHGCEGCHNPESHDFAGGRDCTVAKLLEEIDKNPLLKGVTLSGGEPFCQAGALAPFAKEVKARGLDLFCYSGYTFEQLLGMAVKSEDCGTLLGLLDVLVDGPYLQAQRDLTLRFRGSSNQRILDVKRSLEKGEALWAAIEE